MVTKEKTYKRKVWNIFIEYVSGQSMTPFKVFEGIYYPIEDKKIISNFIAQIITPNYDGAVDEYLYVNCVDEKLKLEVITAIMKKEQSFNITTSENGCGVNWGYNVKLEINDIVLGD